MPRSLPQRLDMPRTQPDDNDERAHTLHLCATAVYPGWLRLAATGWDQVVRPNDVLQLQRGLRSGLHPSGAAFMLHMEYPFEFIVQREKESESRLDARHNCSGSDQFDPIGGAS